MMTPNNQNAVSTIAHNNVLRNQPILQPAPTMVHYEEEIEISTYLDILYERSWFILKIALWWSLVGIAFIFFSQA